MPSRRKNQSVRPWFRLGLWVAALVTAAPASASQTTPVDLKSCVRAAGVAFAGTVSNLRPEKLESTIVTRITFSDVVYAKGRRKGDTVVLTICGGEVNGTRLDCGGSPKFRANQRYIVLAVSDLGSRRNAYSPIVYMNQGLFTLEVEKEGGPPVVRGVVGYRDGHVLVASRTEPPTPPYPLYTKPGVIAVEFVPDTGERFDEGEFLALIRTISEEK